MSYGVSGALQASVYLHLAADTALAGLVGTAIYDAIPAGTLPAIYVTLGPEKVRERSDAGGQGAEHEFTISVISDAGGFAAAKATATAVSDSLTDAALTLSRGSLIYLHFLRAAAARTGTGDTRQIDLTFRARVEDH